MITKANFQPKYQNHKYKDKIIEHFAKDTPLSEIAEYLSAFGEEHKLSIHTLRYHKQKYLASKRGTEQLVEAKTKFTDATDLEYYLMETIVQCRARKESKNISGKDFQYYDTQMQSAIKLLADIRGSDQRGMGMDEVFRKLAVGLQKKNDGSKPA